MDDCNACWPPDYSGCRRASRENASAGLLPQSARACGAFHSDGYTRPPLGADFHLERGLENLLEQFAVVHLGGRANPQAFAAMQQHRLVGEFRRQVQLVRNHHYGVPILFRQLAQPLQEANLSADIEVQSGLVQQQQQRLLRQRPSQSDALLFPTRDLVYPAVPEMLGTSRS